MDNNQSTNKPAEDTSKKEVSGNKTDASKIASPEADKSKPAVADKDASGNQTRPEFKK